ncbi:hypothetical protein FML11_26175 [Klebsiella oxytoca]|uniref:hypothetical protein n=1 Tax=Klebsiella oxytoca TaxID=571 RepID=UPI001CCF24DA|nr:hypothetical protein [Klebsiella oxytoca]MBZ7636768.1 hypothetical protein [Klebsiella oxytoca]
MVKFSFWLSEWHNRMGGLEEWGLPGSLRATEMEVRGMIELIIAILTLIAAVLQLINWFL